MPKEMIVSVNGREKKIAILEDGRVTEFYIERGENGQGIVGNIYKGRVMRVLPGMQSAFVDIGLERDAFLYVSDFFDEEEEFERIVVDKTKGKGAVDTEAAERAAAERIERARIERERAIETAQERAQPIADGDEAETEDEEEEETQAVFESVTDDDEDDFEQSRPQEQQQSAPEQRAPASATTAQQQPLVADETGGDADRRRGRRNRRGGRGQERPAEQQQQRPQETATPPAQRVPENFEDRLSSLMAGERPSGAGRLAGEDIDTPFVAGASSFERVIDDEAAAEEGSMFKDARMQERLLDQIRGVEFDIEPTGATEVGSLLSSGGASGSSSFQRIDDSDDEETPRELQAVQETVAASIAHLADEFAEDDSPASLNNTQSFERISDDEKSVEAVGAQTGAGGTQEARGKRGGSSSRARGGSAKKARQQTGSTDASASGAAAGSGDTTETVETEETTGAASKKRRGAGSRTAAASGTGSGAGAAKKGAAKASSKSSTKSASKKGASTKRAKAKESGTEGVDSSAGGGATPADAEASVGSRRSRGEFARRGGRRRRRPGGKPGEEGVEEGRSNGNGEDAGGTGDAEEIVIAAPEVPQEAPAVAAPQAQATPTTPSQSRGRNPRGDGGRTGGGRGDSHGRGGRGDEGRPPRGDDNRPPRGGSEEARGGDGGRSVDGGRGGDGGRGADGGGGRGGGRDRRDRMPPTITDLLREGQEIIVQIAKEPISQKGARITSHIALPGRFLVYMPTIEHTGVSRKIESDSERVRLRKLIQAITKEEDVPSGGFIVRTAGVGMSEADLRQDARYLVRTWRDIRRNAEKVKAPSLAHKDLDLVQRILRDQLSDDFTAIRSDSEEEYLAIVEFINRIQPRLVNRVKLYTRDEPILEAYGVQAEIEKAIKPRVWLRSGGYLVINQTEALVAIDVNTGKFVGRGGSRLEDTITRTNMEAVDEIARQIRLRDLGGIIVLDLIDMEDRRNRNRVMAALQDALRDDKSPTKVLSFNDFGLVIMTRKRVKQSLERTLCSPCPYCQGSSLVKSPQTVCYEILEEARRLSREHEGEIIKQTTLRVNPEVSRALRSTEGDVLTEIEDYLGSVDITSDEHVHQEQFDFAFI